MVRSNVVERGDPFQYANVTPLALEIIPEPVIASVNPWLPAVIFDGNRFEMIGVALFVGALLPPQPPSTTAMPVTSASAPHHERFNPASLKLAIANLSTGIPLPPIAGQSGTSNEEHTGRLHIPLRIRQE